VIISEASSKDQCALARFGLFHRRLNRGNEASAEALEILGGIKSPMYGVPGNHDYWSKAPFDGIARVFAATGGGWLLDGQQVTQDGKFSIIGATCLGSKQASIRIEPKIRNIFLMHYPVWVENLAAEKFDLILAGHSHGGQVRLPFTVH